MAKQKIIISVLNQKGGVGKTTTTINAGAYLAKLGKKVLLIDADPQANTTSGLGIERSNLESTLCDVMISDRAISQTIVNTKFKNLDLIPSDPRLASVEVELASKISREMILNEALKDISGYDIILVDCPPALGLLTINSLSASDFVLIPVQAEYYALEGLSQLLEVVQIVRKKLNPRLELIGVLMTMFDKRNSLSRQVYQEIEKYFGDKIFETIIPRNVRLAEAPSYGKPVSEHDKWSKGARAYKSLAKELIDRLPVGTES